MSCWLYMNGNMSKPPIRAFADANCDVWINQKQEFKDGKPHGESGAMIPENFIEYNPKHIIKIRDGWDGFSDEKYYGKIKTKPGDSPFAPDIHYKNKKN